MTQRRGKDMETRRPGSSHGYAVTATWLNSQRLQAFVAKNGHIEGPRNIRSIAGRREAEPL
jgi:hypothetical protein